MSFYGLKKLSFLLITASFCLSLAGCQSGNADQDDVLERPEAINDTIGTIASIYEAGATEVRGFGIVAGLAGTGSRECPPDLREKLISQIKIEMRELEHINPESFINSMNTAVVEVYGVMPVIASKGEPFDLRVAALTSTGTSSLKGGYLYTTNLVKHSKFFNIKMHLTPVAKADGAIFLDKSNDKKKGKVDGYILSGGRVSKDVDITMLMHNPNHLTANVIRNLINAKFGKKTSKATSDKVIQLTIPRKYRHNKPKFLAMVRLLYMGNDPKILQNRIHTLISELSNNNDKLTPEIALEAIGKRVTDELLPLLSHADEAVRFHAARCMLNLTDDRALKVLQAIIENPTSKFRIDAIKAIGIGARQNDAVAILNKHLQSEDFDIAFTVYEQLRNLRDIAITRYSIAGDFFLETIMCAGPKRIYATRKGVPRIVIFGEPLECEDNLFVQSDDGEIMINARKGAKVISVSRNNPNAPGIIGPRFTTFKVRDLIKILGEASKVPKKEKKRPGLSVPYYDILAILEKMCKNKAIKAEFIAGDLPVFPKLDKAETDKASSLP